MCEAMRHDAMRNHEESIAGKGQLAGVLTFLGKESCVEYALNHGGRRFIRCTFSCSGAVMSGLKEWHAARCVTAVYGAPQVALCSPGPRSYAPWANETPEALYWRCRSAGCGLSE